MNRVLVLVWYGSLLSVSVMAREPDTTLFRHPADPALATAVRPLTVPIPPERPVAGSPDTAYQQLFRPQFHFSPRANWINNPNGLVYYAGEYHLFYQYNPFASSWGNMSWGHAISRDLVHWRELPPAITPEDSTQIFSGSCVIDKTNSSGFGHDGIVPMVAVYTTLRRNQQSQCLAYSLDKGRTWTKYTANPVLDLQQANFRDPKVFWHEPSQRWVMVVLLPTQRRVLFYNSPDLKAWAKTGEFKAPGRPTTVVWESPDLVEVPVDSMTKKKWLLLLSVDGGGPAGGTGVQYYVGQFNGQTFVSDGKTSKPRFADYGKDYYAATTYNNLPRRGNRGPISIGWMNNWQYASTIPTTSFRGAMTLPRELHLVRKTEKKLVHYELRQQPVQELTQLLGQPFDWVGTTTNQLDQQLATTDLPAETYMMTIDMAPTASRENCRILLNKSSLASTDSTVIGYDMVKQQLYIGRGQAAVGNGFSGRFTAPLQLKNGRISLQIWVDRASVEVFANDGQVTMTSQMFPDPTNAGITFQGDGSWRVTIQAVSGIWR